MRELTAEATEALYTLRQASRDVVESVKAMKHLHKNLSKHGASGNLAIREEYDAMRLIIAKLMRALYAARRDPADVIPLSMDALKLELEKSSRQLIAQLDDKIRQRRIQPAVATSIMNDEGYTRELGRNLIDALQVILTESDVKSHQDLTLSGQEIEQLATDTAENQAKA
jgi:phosphate:Na+ symporter